MTTLLRTRRSSDRFLIGFFGSILTHGAIVLLILYLFLHRAEGSGPGGGGSGEDGHAGAGDTSLDVSLASPAATEIPAPEETVIAPPTPTTPPIEKAAPDEMTEPVASAHPQKVLPPLPQAAEAATGHDATTNGGKLVGPTRIEALGSGGGVGGGSGSGDSIEGQRALLPKAAVCKDPIAGRWEALKFSPIRRDWVHFLLTVHRSSSSVSGTILSHTWQGGPHDSVPPGCDFGGFDITVSMNASGATGGEHIVFGASRYTIVTERCPSIGMEYVPDQFSGTIDPNRQEFQSLNNDGVVDINVPYVFRRTGCIDE